MELIFLGTGQSEPVKARDRTQSSLIVKTGNKTFLINCTPNFLEQVSRENIDNIDFILFTRAHLDCIGGIPDLKEWMDKKNLNKITAFMEVDTYKEIKQKFKSLSHLDIKYFQPNTSFGGKILKIIPFRINSQSKLSCGFRFLDIVYSEVGEIPPESLKYYDDANVIIFDAPMWFGNQVKGHQNIAEALQFAKEIKPKQLILTNGGSTYPSQQIAEAEIRQYWRELSGGDTRIIFGDDGLKITLREHISQILHEIREGMKFGYPNGSTIYSGEKKLIIEPKLYKNKINKFLYLIEDSLCFGIIRLKLPDKINLEEFKKLEDEHNINEEDRTKWWPYKEILYAYEFDIIELFDEPKKVFVPQGVQTFVKDFKFLEQELINDPKSYDPEKLTTESLRNDWRIVNAWYSAQRQGKKVKYSIETIINLAKLIYLELDKRGSKFNPEKMRKYPAELYNKVSGTELEDLSNPDLLKEFGNKTLIKDFISVVGSYAEGKNKPNDVDILVRMNNPSDFIKRSVEVRILKNVNFSQDVHFIWGDPEGPHDTFIPLYDLELKRIHPLKIVKMQEEIIDLKSVIPFNPMKSHKRFYQVDETVSYMFKTGTENQFAIEKKFKGYRVILMKTGDRVKIYSDQKKDISKQFQTILSEARDLTNKDFVLDSELVYGSDGRSEIAKYIDGKEKLDDSKIELHAFDCIYHDKDLTNETWHERKTVLHSFNFTPHINEVHSIIVSNPDGAEKTIRLLRNLSGSEGAMIKRYDGKYSKNKDSDAWIKFGNEEEIIEHAAGDTTTTTPGISSVAGKIWVKKRIKAPDHKMIELQGEEGGEEMVKNFPDRMQRNFNKIKDWKPFVIQWHLRGEKSLHTDLRFDVGEILEGFTLFTPPSINKPDLLTENPQDIRGTIKVPQPKIWLTVQGGYESGAPGTTSKHNAYFSIVAKGNYRPIEIDDHKIVFELKTDSGTVKEVKALTKEDEPFVKAFNNKLPKQLKKLDGCFSYHITHIKDKYIILFDKLKKCLERGTNE